MEFKSTNIQQKTGQFNENLTYTYSIMIFLYGNYRKQGN